MPKFRKPTAHQNRFMRVPGPYPGTVLPDVISHRAPQFVLFNRRPQAPRNQTELEGQKPANVNPVTYDPVLQPDVVGNGYIQDAPAYNYGSPKANMLDGEHTLGEFGDVAPTPVAFPAPTPIKMGLLHMVSYSGGITAAQKTVLAIPQNPDRKKLIICNTSNDIGTDTNGTSQLYLTYGPPNIQSSGIIIPPTSVFVAAVAADYLQYTASSIYIEEGDFISTDDIYLSNFTLGGGFAVGWQAYEGILSPSQNRRQERG